MYFVFIKGSTEKFANDGHVALFRSAFHRLISVESER